MFRAPEILCGSGNSSRGPRPCCTPASKNLWGKPPCSPPISASSCIFRLVMETLGLAGHRGQPFTVGLLPRTACVSRLHPTSLSLPFLPRGSRHFHAALLPILALQPMPLLLLVAVSRYLVVVVVLCALVCCESDSTMSAGPIVLARQPVSRKFLLHELSRRNRCPVAYGGFHTLTVGPTWRDNALQPASRFRDYNPMITLARYSSGDSVARGLSLCVLSR